jgi:hypothetical protein
VPTHFLGLTGAATLDTRQFQLAGRVMDDLVEAIGRSRYQDLPNGCRRVSSAA